MRGRRPGSPPPEFSGGGFLDSSRARVLPAGADGLSAPVADVVVDEPLGGLQNGGEAGRSVTEALRFLREYNIRGTVPTGKKVVVIGGGNAAIDAARTALRLGDERSWVKADVILDKPLRFETVRREIERLLPD